MSTPPTLLSLGLSLDWTDGLLFLLLTAVDGVTPLVAAVDGVTTLVAAVDGVTPLEAADVDVVVVRLETAEALVLIVGSGFREGKSPAPALSLSAWTLLGDG